MHAIVQPAVLALLIVIFAALPFRGQFGNWSRRSDIDRLRRHRFAALEPVVAEPDKMATAGMPCQRRWEDEKIRKVP